MKIDLKKLKEVGEKATEGPWELCDRGDYSDFDGQSRVILGNDVRLAVVHTDGRKELEANAKLLVTARNNWNAMIEKLNGATKKMKMLAFIGDEEAIKWLEGVEDE